MTKLTNEDNVQQEMANHNKHYWAIVQGLKRKRKDAHDLAEMIGEGSTVALAIWNKYVDFDFTKRMAEGAAGEAASQGDLLAALKVAKVTLANWSREPELNSLATYLDDTIYNHESGSASTAGPRPRCPKCGNNFFDVRAGTAYCCDTALLTGCNYQGPVAQFFAAAPAERTQLVTPRCPKCGIDNFHRTVQTVRCFGCLADFDVEGVAVKEEA